VVEDERIVAGDIESRLNFLGYRVPGIAPSGEAAIQAVETLRPDLVLMDIHLEGDMDGTQAANVIRERFGVPVVYLTAHADSSTLQRAKTTDPFGYLLKPFNDHELRTAIELALYKHQTERRLMESEALFRGVAETVTAAIILFRDRTIIYVNRFTEPLSGYTIAELKSMNILDVVHPDFRALMEERLAARERGETVPARYEFKLVRKDGSERWVDFSTTSLAVEGKPTWLWTAFDITDRKLAEEQHRTLEASLAQIQKMESIGSLVAGLAHHFNNLLAIIQGYAQRISRTPAEASRVIQSARAIESASQRGASLIQQLIGVARKANIQLAPIRVNELVTGVEEVLREIFPPSIRIVLELSPSSPQIAGEQSQIQQALMNICLNAREAMPQGGQLTITTGLVHGSLLREFAPHAEPIDYIRVTVADTGTGMSEIVREHIYEPFFTTKDRALHTGMGLSIVYGIVASHQGFVGVESTEGRGSTIQLYLPAVTAAGTNEVHQAAPASGKTILIVEDESTLRSLTREILIQEGYAVLEAKDGAEGLARFTHEHRGIDLVLLDLGLPQVAGDAVFHQLRAIDPRVPIVISSGFLRRDHADGSLREHATAVIHKPFAVNELLSTVRQALNATGNWPPKVPPTPAR
jgi:hypothetical protein